MYIQIFSFGDVARLPKELSMNPRANFALVRYKNMIILAGGYTTSTLYTHTTHTCSLSLSHKVRLSLTVTCT